MSDNNKKISKDGLKEYRKLVIKNFLKKKLVVAGFVITVIMALISLPIICLKWDIARSHT